VGRLEPSRGNRFLKPQDNIVTRAAFVIAEVVVKAEMSHFPRLKQLYDLIGPASLSPAVWSDSYIVEVYLHGVQRLVDITTDSVGAAFIGPGATASVAS